MVHRGGDLCMKSTGRVVHEGGEWCINCIYEGTRGDNGPVNWALGSFRELQECCLSQRTSGNVDLGCLPNATIRQPISNLTDGVLYIIHQCYQFM